MVRDSNYERIQNDCLTALECKILRTEATSRKIISSAEIIEVHNQLVNLGLNTPLHDIEWFFKNYNLTQSVRFFKKLAIGLFIVGIFYLFIK